MSRFFKWFRKVPASVWIAIAALQLLNVIAAIARLNRVEYVYYGIPAYAINDPFEKDFARILPGYHYEIIGAAILWAVFVGLAIMAILRRPPKKA
jgi:hypothetical protein